MGTMDFNELAKGIDDLREGLRAVIAGLIEDGFTDREARRIVAGCFNNEPETPEEGGAP